MSELKPGWRRHRFGEMVASVGATRKARGWRSLEVGVDRYVGLEHLDSNCLKIRRWGSPEDVGTNSDLRLFEAGDVILARRGIELRKIGVAEFRGVASGHALVFRANPVIVLPDFLPFFMQSDTFMKRADRFSVGSLSRTVNLSSLMRQEFALPPLAEQRRQLQMLVALRDCVEASNEVERCGQSARGSLLIELYRPKSNWLTSTLGSRYEIQLGKKLSHETDAQYVELPYLRNANVQWNRLELADIALMPFNQKERAKYRLRSGDILACEGRHVGKAAMWRDEMQEVYYQMSLHRLRPHDPARDHPEFMLHYLEFCSRVGIFAQATGETTIPHMSASRFAAIKLQFPDVAEQVEIAEAIGEFDRNLARANERAGRTRAMYDAAVDQLLGQP